MQPSELANMEIDISCRTNFISFLISKLVNCKIIVSAVIVVSDSTNEVIKIVEAFISQNSLSVIIIFDKLNSVHIFKSNIIEPHNATIPKSLGWATLAIIIDVINPISWVPPVFAKLQKYGVIFLITILT